MAQPHIPRSIIVPITVKAANSDIHTGRIGISLSLADILLLANVVVANITISVLSLLLTNVIAMVLAAVGVIEAVSAKVAVESDKMVSFLLAVVATVFSFLIADVVADTFGANTAVKVVVA
jgi:hypothetical protein